MTGRPGSFAPAVAAHRLAGARLDIPPKPLDDDAWADLVVEVRLQRLTGLLADAVSSGAFPATDEQVAEAAAAHEAAMDIALRLERKLLDTASAFEDAGIEYRVLKGPAFAHTIYDDPALRAFGDVDLLVPGGDVEPARDMLVAAGCERRYPEPRPGFDRRFGKSVTLEAPDGFEIDLHRTLVLGPFGLTVDTGDLFADPSWFTLGGRRLPALGPETRFLHACYHAVLGEWPPRMLPLRDVAQALLTADLDTESVLSTAASWRARAVVARAVRATWQTFALADVVPLSVWAARYEPDAWERRALSVHTRRKRYGAKALASVRAIPGVRGKAAFVHSLLTPNRAFFAGRDAGYLRWWRKGVRSAVRQEPVR